MRGPEGVAAARERLAASQLEMAGLRGKIIGKAAVLAIYARHAGHFLAEGWSGDGEQRRVHAANLLRLAGEIEEAVRQYEREQDATGDHVKSLLAESEKAYEGRKEG